MVKDAPDFESLPPHRCKLCEEMTPARWALPCYRRDDPERVPRHRVCMSCYNRQPWIYVDGERVETFVAVREREAVSDVPVPARAPKGAEPKKRKKPTMAERLLER